MTGFIESEITGDEIVYSSSNDNLNEYKVKDLLPVIDQGNRGICCAVVCAEIQNIIDKYNHKGDIKNDYVYNKRSNKNIDGMTPKEAFEILKKDGYISDYARITNQPSLKDSILVNGPALIALPVYSFDSKFWEGSKYQGGHAVAVVGFDNEGFLIKNSWGKEWSNNGYTTLPYDEFNKIIEAWCVIS